MGLLEEQLDVEPRLPDGSTFGLELEWSDWNTRVELPSELGQTDGKEYTVVNSDGTAFASEESDDFGGEIQMTPVGSIAELVENVGRLKQLVTERGGVEPKALYRSSLHVHIAVPGLKDDVELLKKSLSYTRSQQVTINRTIFQFERPYFSDPHSKKLADSWSRKKAIWSRREVPGSRMGEILASKTFEEFYEAHYAPRKSGKGRAYSFGVRSGTNYRSLHKHGTVEFRFFYGSTDLRQIRSCLEFSERLLLESLTTQRPVSEWLEAESEARDWEFPSQPPFDPELEKRFLGTERKH